MKDNREGIIMQKRKKKKPNLKNQNHKEITEEEEEAVVAAGANTVRKEEAIPTTINITGRVTDSTTKEATTNHGDPTGKQES